MEFETTKDLLDFMNWCIRNNYIQYTTIDGVVTGDLYITEKGCMDMPERIYEDYVREMGLDF